MRNHDRRPVYLNLAQIRLPVTAVLSFGHRVSGVLLFLSLPFLIYLFERSLSDAQGYAAVRAVLGSPLGLVALTLLLWLFAHHFFAGLRFLFIDIDRGVGLRSARRSARLVLWAAPVVAVLGAVLLLW